MHSKPFILLAPMEGVIDVVIRHMLSQTGGMDRLVTEFVRVTDKLLPDHVFYKYCPELLNHKGHTSHGLPVFVQLLGGQVEPLAENAHKVMELGAPGIDLNFGCPAKTVNRHDGGASLLKNPERLYKIISAIKSSTKNQIPVTAKVRLGFEDKSLVKEIAQAVNSAGASALTIHARTKLEGYAPPAHWEYIRIMSEQVSIPVIANGDIWTVEDYIRCREVSGCKDVALGRGVMSRPSLAREIRAYSMDNSLKSSTDYMEWQEILHKYLPEFILRTLEYRGENYTLPRLKQLLKFLSREYTEAEVLFEKVKVCRQASELKGVFDAECKDVCLDLLPILSASKELTQRQRGAI